jgi:hypothetical protein
VACCLHRQINVSPVTRGHMRDHLSVGWIKDLERLARLRIQPFSADQQLTLGREKASRQLLSHQ